MNHERTTKAERKATLDAGVGHEHLDLRVEWPFVCRLIADIEERDEVLAWAHERIPPHVPSIGCRICAILDH